jgi:hypothetical protein
MNKRDFSPDKQLLRKIVGHFVAISMRASTQKAARTSKELMERDYPSLRSYIKAENVYPPHTTCSSFDSGRAGCVVFRLHPGLGRVFDACS